MEVDAKYSRRTALMEAAKSGHMRLVRLLIEKGAEVNLVHKGYGTAPTFAAAKGRTKVVKLLLAQGALVDALGNNGATALILAARSGHTPVVRALVGKGADVNAQDNDGNTALIVVPRSRWQKNKHQKTVDLLLKIGADPAIRNNAGKNAQD